MTLFVKRSGYTVAEKTSHANFVCVLSRHMVMCSQILHLRVNRSSIAVLTCSDCDQTMRDCEYSEKGKTDPLLWTMYVCVLATVCVSIFVLCKCDSLPITHDDTWLSLFPSKLLPGVCCSSTCTDLNTCVMWRSSHKSNTRNLSRMHTNYTAAAGLLLDIMLNLHDALIMWPRFKSYSRQSQ